MTLEEFRQQMRAYRDAANREAISSKNSQAVVREVREFYEKLEQPERQLADIVIGEWVVDSDESLRFDAFTLINTFNIRSAVDPLKRLAARLATTKGAGCSRRVG